jgi:CubicO group peptidase (beta-lactamase class C family)
LLAQGTFEGKPSLSKETVTEIFAASMVQGVGGPLHDPNDSAGLGCESYHFLRWRVIEKNGALNGMRTIVTLIPERGLGIAIFANKQVTVFPEAVRAEFLERVLGPSGQDLQKQMHAEQKGWLALLDVPKPPADAKPLARDLDAFTGHFVSPLYGSLVVMRNGESLAVKIGPRNYPGKLTHWSADSFLITFENPDIPPGLLTFAFKEAGSRATGFDGSRVRGAFTTSYGHFDRAE